MVLASTSRSASSNNHHTPIYLGIMPHLRTRAVVAFVSAFAVTTGTFAAAANVANANANADMPQSTNGVQRRSAVDCTEYQHTFEMPFSGGAVVMDYVVSDDTFRARLTRQGTGWVGLAVPEDPNCMNCMKNSDAVIGVPGGVPGGSVLKYDLESYMVDGVVPMEASMQTLLETSVEENEFFTVVTFAKKLKEDGENGINGNGPNTFLWAMGPEGLRGQLAYHTLKGKFQLDLTPCDVATTSPEAESPNMPVLDMTGATLDDDGLPVTSAAGTATTTGILRGGIIKLTAVCSLFLTYFM